MLEKEGGNLVHYRKCNKKLIKYKVKLQYTGPRVSINIKSSKEESTKIPLKMSILWPKCQHLNLELYLCRETLLNANYLIITNML